MLVTGRQIAAARAILSWSQPALAASSGVSLPTIRRIEATPGIPSSARRNVLAIIRALEAGGVSFVRTEDTIGIVTFLPTPRGGDEDQVPG